MKTLIKIISAFLFLFFNSNQINAQAGTPDPTFGTNGIVLVDALAGNDYSIIQPDGKILLASFNLGFTLDRFLPDGRYDSSFAENGHLYYTIGTKIYGQNFPNSMALQPDGKIICTVMYFPGNHHKGLGIIRCTPDGRIDSSFGRNGLDTLDLDDLMYAKGLVVQPDGKIVVAGDVLKNEYDEKRTFLCRYMPDGGLDTSFGEGGVTITHYPYATSSNSLILRPDGRLVRGSTYGFYAGDDPFLLESFNPDGSIDSSFGVNGRAKYVFELGQGVVPFNYMYAMALQADGKIVCTGISGDEEKTLMAVCRFNADGSVDKNFGEDGGTITSYKEYKDMFSHSIAIQPDGKILTCGIAWGSTDITSPLLVCRYNENGQLDPGFGENGISGNLRDSIYLDAETVHYLSTGKVLVTGTSDYDILLMRFNGDNILATHFKNVKAVQDKTGVTISWETLEESGTKSYSVERSSNATEFVNIATVPAKGGTENKYSYTDQHPLQGIAYYRIKENALNGTATYSNTLKVIFESNSLALYPNPAKSTLTITGLNKLYTATIRITDIHGREILQQKTNNNSELTLTIRALAQGSYFVLVEQNGKVEKLRFIKE